MFRLDHDVSEEPCRCLERRPGPPWRRSTVLVGVVTGPLKGPAPEDPQVNLVRTDLSPILSLGRDDRPLNGEPLFESVNKLPSTFRDTTRSLIVPTRPPTFYRLFCYTIVSIGGVIHFDVIPIDIIC